MDTYRENPEGIVQTVEPPAAPTKKRPLLAVGMGVGAVAIIALLLFMVWRAEAKTNKVALASRPKPVGVVTAKEASFRSSRTYVGTIQPWVGANIGPQLVSAYVATVLVRPGAPVKRGDVLATLDCRFSTASSQAVAMQAQALEKRQQALADQAARVSSLAKRGFEATNTAEQMEAQSAAEQAQLLAERANLTGRTLEVNDCILRAPFDGEISARTIDPGAFVRPGTPIVSEVDRGTVRVVTDVPEVDFDVVKPGTPVVVHVISTGKDLNASVSRRAPSADPGTRTVECEIDIADPNREIPVGTTGEVRVDVGDPVPATEIPLAAAIMRSGQAEVYVITDAKAHKLRFPILGESGGSLFLSPELASGASVVLEGRALLSEGDAVAAQPAGAGGAP